MANEQNAALGGSSLFPGLQKTNSPVEEESKNVFTELFGKDPLPKSGPVLNTLIQQQDKKNTSFFGDKPPVKELTLKQFVKHDSHPATTFVQVSFLILFLVVSVFLTQNSAAFSILGVNPALRVENLQSQVGELTAEVRVQKHLTAALLLDQYVGTADAYLYNVAQASSLYTSQNKKVEFAAAVTALRPEVVSLLTRIQEKIEENIPDSEGAAAVLTAEQLINQLRDKKGQGNDAVLLQDIQDLETTKTLIQNGHFRSLLAGIDLTQLTDEQIESVLSAYTALNASSNAIISSIKSARPEWSLVLDELEAVIKSVDPLFGTEFSTNLILTDIVFNDDGTVSVAGKTSTSDTTNFTLASNLIDALENSSTFQNAMDRSYQKTDEETTYTGSFHISMELENNPTSND